MILLLTQEVILKYMRHVLCGIVLIMMSALPMWAQIDSVTVRLKEQLRRFPQEKVALHVDRTVLLAGDTVRGAKSRKYYLLVCRNICNHC